jgi:hypothetical protein
VSKRLALRLILCFIDEQKGKHDASHWYSRRTSGKPLNSAFTALWDKAASSGLPNKANACRTFSDSGCYTMKNSAVQRPDVWMQGIQWLPFQLKNNVR